MVHIEHDGIVFHLSNLSEDRLALRALPGEFRPYFPRVFGNPVLIDFLLARGIYVAPSQFECMFPSLAHGDDEIDRTIDAVRSFHEATD